MMYIRYARQKYDMNKRAIPVNNFKISTNYNQKNVYLYLTDTVQVYIVPYKNMQARI